MNDKSRRRYSGGFHTNRRNEISQWPAESSNFKKQTKNLDIPSNSSLLPRPRAFTGGLSPTHGDQKKYPLESI